VYTYQKERGSKDNQGLDRSTSHTSRVVATEATVATVSTVVTEVIVVIAEEAVVIVEAVMIAEEAVVIAEEAVAAAMAHHQEEVQGIEDHQRVEEDLKEIKKVLEKKRNRWTKKLFKIN